MLKDYASLPLDLSKTSKAEIKDYFLKTYALFEKLFEIFASDEAFYEQPEPLRHPLIFYYGHTACFYVNKMFLKGLIHQRVNPFFEKIFAIGVDEMSWDDLNPNNYAWPSVQEVKSYRARVRDLVLEVIERTPLALPIGWNDDFWVILMGIEHEKIHIETSSVLHRQLDLRFIKDNGFFTPAPANAHASAPENELIKVSGGLVRLGKEQGSALYGWDNEYGVYEEELAPFEAAKYLTSNGEFLAFVQDGGYARDEFWSEEGRAWKRYKNAKHPVFWVEKAGEFFYRNLTQETPLPLNFPAEVNYLEAEAFCAWLSQKSGKNISLPSEAMWHRLYESVLGGEEIFTGKGNVGFERYASACAVNECSFGEFYDIYGNVWQWTSTPIDAFLGFKTHEIYDDFSVPTFDNRHNIIKGGSFASTGNEATKSSRYAFRRHFYQHAGFRYVCSSAAPKILTPLYDADLNFSERVFREYLQSSYDELLAHFARGESVLHLGCGTGAFSFRLLERFKSVTALDFTARLIKIPQVLMDKGRIDFGGENGFGLELKDFLAGASGQDLGTRAQDPSTKDPSTASALDLSRLSFWQGDVTNLKDSFSGYDCIFLQDAPSHTDLGLFFGSLAKRLNSRGVFISAYPAPFKLAESFNFDEREYFIYTFG